MINCEVLRLHDNMLADVQMLSVGFSWKDIDEWFYPILLADEDDDKFSDVYMAFS